MALQVEIDVGVATVTINHPPTNLDAVAAVKRVVDAPTDQALVVESNEVARLLSMGAHGARMDRFVAAGGQTRDAEINTMQTILDAVLERQ